MKRGVHRPASVRRRRLVLAAGAVLVAACASPDRRIDPAKVKLFALDESPIRSLRVVLAPVDDLRLVTAYRESAAGWNTPLFDQRFGPRLVANLRANGIAAQFRGASGLGVEEGVPADWLMMVQVLGWRYSTRNGLQDGDAIYDVRVSLFRRGSDRAVLVYEDQVNRAAVATHDTLPDRFTYGLLNLLRERGRWPAERPIVVAG